MEDLNENISEDEIELQAPVKRTRRKKNYLNNADLMRETVKSQKDGKMTDELAKMLMVLCDRYRSSRTGNFTRYTYFDEMKSAAIENLVKNAWHKFDAENYENPFAYYTSCVHNSYIQYLKYEKKHRNIRDSLMVKHGLDASFTYMEEHSSAAQATHESDNVVDNYQANLLTGD